MDKILVTGGGTALVLFIYWFFFGKKEAVVEVGERVEVIVDGGYQPANIKVKKGEKTTLILKRKDPNSCLEEFILPDFKIRQYLPLNKEVRVEIEPKVAGTYGFHCGMNMYHGKIIVS